VTDRFLTTLHQAESATVPPEDRVERELAAVMAALLLHVLRIDRCEQIEDQALSLESTLEIARTR
jgi:hypothetical protein